METTIFDGKEAARRIREEIKEEAKREGLRPTLTVVLVGNNSVSLSYIKRKEKACQELGFGFELHQLPANSNFEEVEGHLSILNSQFSINGIILQLPLPENLVAHQLAGLILNSKDVDGLTTDSPFVPPTALAVIHVLESQQITISGAKTLVIGRGPTAGRPIARLLKKLEAEVTVAHSQTPPTQLTRWLSAADIIISCVGRPHLIRGSMIKEGATVIGVGLSRLVSLRSDLQRETRSVAKGRSGLPETPMIQGDLDLPSLLGRASLVTPTPGGIGPLTVAFLLKNLLQAAENQSVEANPFR